jgi:hemerythrin-like metal-binding protein
MITPVEIFPWDANFETGIERIDTQHQQLVGLLNRLVSHLAFQSDAPTLDTVFGQLRDYVELHFTTEEAIWQNHLGEDRSVAEHHRAHGNFVDEVLRLKAEESSKPLETVIENIVNFLTRWLALHILESDRRMALVVQGVERGLPIDAARHDFVGCLWGCVDRQEPLPAPQAQRLTHIEDASNHLLSVINGILDLSRIEAGKFMLDEGPVSPKEVVRRAVGMLAQQAENRGLYLRTADALPDMPLLGDATRLRQALINYLMNAVKFTAQGGITVRCTLAEDSGDTALIRFEVEDTGPGIPADQLARLFEPYEQGGILGACREGGTGLGLTITSRLAEMMGGEAGARSELGHGSCFWFTARLRKSTAASTALPAIDAETARRTLADEHHGARVLLAADDEINRAIIRVLVSRAQLDVTCVANGDEARSMAEHIKPDVILMDMQMPGIDGIEATRLIRAQDWGLEVPIIALTANAFSEDRARCLEAGMDDFVTKPVSPAHLYETLRHWLGKGRTRTRQG